VNSEEIKLEENGRRTAISEETKKMVEKETRTTRRNCVL